MLLAKPRYDRTEAWKLTWLAQLSYDTQTAWFLVNEYVHVNLAIYYILVDFLFRFFYFSFLFSSFSSILFLALCAHQRHQRHDKSRQMTRLSRGRRCGGAYHRSNDRWPTSRSDQRRNGDDEHKHRYTKCPPWVVRWNERKGERWEKRLNGNDRWMYDVCRFFSQNLIYEKI